MCPINAGHWHGNGAQGFQFTNVGTWNNYDDDQYQILVCPVPYFPRRERPRPDRREGGHRRLQRGVRRPSLPLRPRELGRQPELRQQGQLPDHLCGTSTLELSLTPSVSTRFVWLEIHIPANDDDNDPFTPNGTSGLVGYRIFRN